MHKLIALGVLSLAFVSCKSAEDSATAEANIINNTCPVMPGESVDPAADTATFNGHTIGFCCDNCVEDFNAWPMEKKQQVVDASLSGR